LQIELKQVLRYALFHSGNFPYFAVNFTSMNKLLADSNMKPARKIHSGGRAKLCFISFFIISSSLIPPSGPSGIISTVAGSAVAGYNKDGIKATSAQLNQPNGVAVDDSGNVYIADQLNNRIRKVYKTTGIIATIAGTGVAGFSGDSGLATLAQIQNPMCVRVDSLRNVYFSDAGNAVIRKINTSGIISTIAGSAGIGGFGGDSSLAVNALLNFPNGICLDKELNIYIADLSNNVIRKVVASTGIIYTVAGSNKAGNLGNGGKATKAKLNSPTGVAVDRAGNMYIADLKNSEIRVVNKQGIISVFAGTGTAGFNGPTGIARTQQLGNPAGIATDAAGNVYIADGGTGLVRKVSISNMQMSVIAGNGLNAGPMGDGGPATSALLYGPMDIAIAKNGDIYIADQGKNNRVRKITPPVAAALVPAK
jgi:trimeric autotransporter adhesin